MGSWLFDDQNMDLPDPVSNIPTRPTTFLILKLFLTLEEGDGALINEAAPYHSYKVTLSTSTGWARTSLLQQDWRPSLKRPIEQLGETKEKVKRWLKLIPITDSKEAGWDTVD